MTPDLYLLKWAVAVVVVDAWKLVKVGGPLKEHNDLMAYALGCIEGSRWGVHTETKCAYSDDLERSSNWVCMIGRIVTCIAEFEGRPVADASSMDCAVGTGLVGHSSPAVLDEIGEQIRMQHYT